LNDEYVVNPPRIPVVRNKRVLSEKSAFALAACRSSAIANEPSTLTATVPHGNPVPNLAVLHCPTR
jgi:hypothetical protein